MSTSSDSRGAAAQPRIAVIIAAAGSGERLGRALPKALVPLAGEPILAHAIRGVLGAEVATEICVAVPRADIELRRVCAGFEEAARGRGVRLCVVDGGSTRSDSVRAGLETIGTDIDAVLVHDAARALTPAVVFHRVAAALAEGADAVIPVLAVVDTIKTVAHTTGEQSRIAPELVTGTPSRAGLRAVQTPQGFSLDALVRAHRNAELFNDAQAASITDDAMLVETSGAPVFAVPGSTRSLKITTPTDLVLAEALLAAGPQSDDSATGLR